MENRQVGWLIIGIAVVIGVIVLIFNTALNTIVGLSCTHGPECTMYDTIQTQTLISFAIIVVIVIIGLVIMFSKPKEKIVLKKVKEQVEVKRKPVDYSKLDKQEKVIVKLLEQADGTIFQSDLVEKSQFSKVKITRILDKLEGRQIIERKRRGMTNVVVLK